MGDIENRLFSKNYSGLINQSVIALAIAIVCVTTQEVFKRRRRGKHEGEGLGSRESWQFGYLYQGRCWAKNPSPPSPAGWPLSWVKQVISFPEDKMNELRGVDATLYIRFLRGCFWFTFLHFLTTFPILFPIHISFSEGSISSKSMTRASIASLVLTQRGLSLLWIHICLLYWITLTWLANLIWICRGAFRLRAEQIEMTKTRLASADATEDVQYHPPPHPQYGFSSDPSFDKDHLEQGLRLRTVMVSKIPLSLRNEKELKEYFEYYMSRKLEKPSVGLTASTQPGFFNKSFAFLFNRAKRIPAHLPSLPRSQAPQEGAVLSDAKEAKNIGGNPDGVPVIDRVVIVRKMTNLASRLHQREEILCRLEAAHIKLARKTLLAVREAMDRRDAHKPIILHHTKFFTSAKQKRRSHAIDSERGEPRQVHTVNEEERMEQLIQVLGPYVEEFGLRSGTAPPSERMRSKAKHTFSKRHTSASQNARSFEADIAGAQRSSPSVNRTLRDKTIWEALHGLPRDALDAYQPLVNLSHLFRGQTVPSIDYHTAKLNFLSSLVTEDRAKAISDFEPVSTAFVTFADPNEARRACKYLAVHPNNPLACMVTPAPEYDDLDWNRLMKTSFQGEFVKDWVVNLGVWAFTVFWLFPVSLLVGLVSIEDISRFLPRLKSYLDKHPWEDELLQSLLPTLLVALLTLLIPLLLLLIAKKAHTITTLSALHDIIMSRYYKFLVVNVLVFFCVGTAAMQTFLQSFKATTPPNILKIVADSFPTAGPFYVGWLIFTVALHGGIELALFGLPLIMYPSTKRQITPRKRTVGIRPRTFNFYYWLPNHLLVIHVLLLFFLLNPFVIPFGTLYFFVEAGVVKNQLIHVYAKNYERNGQLILIRIVRYSLDGLIFAQVVFMAYMIVLKKRVNVGFSAFLILCTAVFKIFVTRVCRNEFQRHDMTEAEIVCGCSVHESESNPGVEGENRECIGEQEQQEHRDLNEVQRRHSSIVTWRLPDWINFSYSTVRQRPRHVLRRQPNPFGPQGQSLPGPGSQVTDLRRINESSQDVVTKTGNAPHHELDSHTSPEAPPLEIPKWGGIEPTALAVPHPPPITWDDQTTCDRPYDNPFYSKPINNVLWLPRDPFAVLDLDDTVDVKQSLTVEATASQLGTWLNIPETSSPIPIEVSSGSVSLPLDSPEPSGMFNSPQLQFDGTEEIDLPLIIAKRVQAQEGEVERTEQPRRPSVYSRRFSSGEKINMSPTGRRRPSFIDGSLPVSVGTPSIATSQGRVRSASIMSTLQLPQSLKRRASADLESGSRPDATTQAEVANASASGMSLVPPRLSRAQNVSSHAAIVQEVMAEEQHALANRLEEEEAEVAKATTTKSWLTSWLFTNLKSE